MLFNHKIKTRFNDVYEIHEQVREDLKKAEVESGICVIYCAHTTAGLTLTSRMDPMGHEDLQDEFTRLVPTKINFKHQVDTPQDAAGHIKASLSGNSISLIVNDGKLLLGSSQGLYFLEFDGPRDRQYFVKFVSDK